MSDTLSDLASWLPSEFLSGDIDDKHPFINTPYPHRLPYDFNSSSSTESDSDDDDFTGLTRRFTRSVSLQERLRIPHPVEKKRVFSGSPESTLNWNVSPTTPFGPADEDAWGLIYAAAGHVARMKMNSLNDGFFVNRGLVGAPRPVGPPLSHHNQHRGMWKSENEVLIRHQQSPEMVARGGNNGSGGRFVAGRPGGFRQSAWSPHPVESQRRQPTAVKAVHGGSSGGCGRETAVVKKACAGTGVFLPRNYCNVSPESKQNPVCPPAHLQPRVLQSFNKSINLDPIIPQPQTNIYGVYSRQHQVSPSPHHQHLKYDKLAEMIMAQRQKTMMLAQQRRTSTHDVVPATRLVQPEVVLPQEWTY